MAEPAHISQVAKEIEARLLLERECEEYDDDDIDHIIYAYRELMKHVGFKDNRSDSRIVVKFHDISYYTPEFDEYDDAFNDFCAEQYHMTVGYELDTHDPLLSDYYAGHYQKFKIDIPEITEDNALKLAVKFFDEFEDTADDQIKRQIELINNMQYLEDTYFEQWLDFLRANEYLPEEEIRKMEHRYSKDYNKRKD